jgi:hypothetical protein
MIHTDGTPTITSGKRGHRLAHVFGIKPEIVEDAISRDMLGCEMTYGAWRVVANLHEILEQRDLDVLTARDVVDALGSLAEDLEAAYRASS